MTQLTKHSVADPAGLGLFGLAIVTLVAASEKLGWTTGVSLVLPWAIFLGCAAQLMASVYDFKRQNVIGGTAFGAFSMFWLGVGMTWLIKLGVFGPALAAQADSNQLAVALIGYLIFSLYMTLAAVETTKLLFFIFLVIDALFAFLILNAFGVYPKLTLALAGGTELVISLMSFYGSAAAVLNLQFGREFLPVGSPFGLFKSAPAGLPPEVEAFATVASGSADLREPLAM